MSPILSAWQLASLRNVSGFYLSRGAVDAGGLRENGPTNKLFDPLAADETDSFILFYFFNSDLVVAVCELVQSEAGCRQAGSSQGGCVQPAAFSRWLYRLLPGVELIGVTG